MTFSRGILIWLAWFSFIPLLAAVNPKIDSLQALLNKEKKEAVRLGLLLDLSDEYKGVDPSKSLEFAREGLFLSRKLKLVKEEATALLLLGHSAIALNQYDSNEYYYLRALALTEKHGLHETKPYALMHLGYLYGEKRLPKLAKSYLHQSILLFREQENATGLASSLSNLASVYADLNKLDSALDYYMQSLKIFNKVGREQGHKAIVLNNIALIYNKLKNPALAVGYHKQAIAIQKANNSRKDLALTYSNLGVAFKGLKQADSAIQYYKLSMELNKELGIIDGIARTSMNLANVLVEKKDFPQAKSYFEQSLKICQQHNIPQGILMNYINIALLYKEMGDVKVAKSYFALAQEMAEPLGNLDYLREIYLGLKDIYSEEGDYKNALKYLEKAKTITDSLNSTRYNEKMAEMQQLHEVELKEIENQALRSENKLQQRKIFSQRIVQQSIIFLSILLAGFIVFIVISRMGIQKKNSQLVQKNAEIERQKTLLDQSNATKDSLFSIIAHDLRNPFNNILGFSQILEEEVQALKEPEIKAHATAIRKAGENAFALLQTLLDWSKTQRNLIQPYYIALNARTLLDEVLSNHQEMATRKNIRLENRVTADLDFQSDPHILHTIFRNLTVNALNHTPPGGLIWVAGKMEETVVTFEIGDTGPGIDPKQAERIFSLRNRFRDEDKPSPHDHGLGLIICKEFTDLLQGTIQLDSQIGQGSVFRIRLPLHHQVNPLQNTNTHDQHA